MLNIAFRLRAEQVCRCTLPPDGGSKGSSVFSLRGEREKREERERRESEEIREREEREKKRERELEES